jgi:uncharacterized repeat protein (TIGR03803 family)
MAWTQAGYAQIAPPLTTLHAFSGNDGSEPYASLIQGKDGNLYGTTSGLNGNNASSNGTVFKITTSGDLTTLYSFSFADGALPYAGLIQGKDGNLYGTTVQGGAYGRSAGGTVFKITTSGTLTTLYSFIFDDGASGPAAALIQGKDGNLYGTTSELNGYLSGEVFKITTSGVLTPLHTFSEPWPGSDGCDSNALIQGQDGDLYGTTQSGGTLTSADPYGFGTVFKITTSGALTTLYSFSALSSIYTNADGAYPGGVLMQDKDGALYGTTYGGGTNGNGTVFKITTSGALTTLYSFNAFTSGYANLDGANPNAGLIQGKDGALYGTTENGGAYGGGTVFKITTSGVLTTLHSFSAPGGYPNYTNADGANPVANLIQAKDGNLYGTTQNSGGRATASGGGTVFKLTMIPVIPSFNPTTGAVGTSITLTGANFTEATKVTFGTIPVNFTINSDTSLTFKVPSPGAASAQISVVNPFGKGTSRGAFVMTPVVNSFSPGKGPVGTTVTLKGANFSAATAVMVGTVAANFTVISDTKMTLTVPTGAVTAPISVVNSYGTGVSKRAFTVTP